ncbi:MAG: methylaspartate mutase subunit S [Dehalococcoidia bacterium]
MREPRTVVIGVLNDIHNLGVMVLRHALDKDGFKVVNAGAMLTHEDFIGAAIETSASALLVSSSYGHAAIDTEGLREKCVEAGLADIIIYIGGNLTVSRQKQSWDDIETTFKGLGFDRVYPQETLPTRVIADLKHDLNIEG